jgi:ABC-2 type transport system ATP-binding protein
MQKLAVEIKNLIKIYKGDKRRKSVKALKGIDLEIKKGEIFALLGPNGAGKSTTIGILSGLIQKTSGQVSVFGLDVEKDYKKTRSITGLVAQELNFDPFFNTRKVLEYQSGLFGVPKNKWIVDEILQKLKLDVHADKHIRELSGGLKRRLMVAKALVHQPQLLILDEPTAGVDVELRQDLWKYVTKLKEQGTTIILTTHYLEEVERMADRIAIMNEGELLNIGTLEELKKKFQANNLEEVYLKLTS